MKKYDSSKGKCRRRQKHVKAMVVQYKSTEIGKQTRGIKRGINIA